MEQKQDCITAKDPHSPRSFLYLRETKSWWCEGEGGEEKVSMLTHTTTRGVSKNLLKFYPIKNWRLDPIPCAEPSRLLVYKMVCKSVLAKQLT